MPASSSLSLTVASASAAALALAGVAGAVTLNDLPKGAHAGECFSRADHPAVWRTFHIAMPQPPLERWRDVPAVYRTDSHEVLVTPARVDHKVIPAVMGTRVHWIEHPGADRLVEATAVYRWEERRVMVEPAHLDWRRSDTGRGYAAVEATQSYGADVPVHPTGEVMCRIRVPARYEVRRVRVLVTPARTCVVKGPSTRERVVERYVVAPERTLDLPVAAVYKTVKARVLVSPARRERIETPQPPRIVDKRVLVTPAETGWKRIDCAPPRVAESHAATVARVAAPPRLTPVRAPSPSPPLPASPAAVQPSRGAVYLQPPPPYRGIDPASTQP